MAGAEKSNMRFKVINRRRVSAVPQKRRSGGTCGAEAVAVLELFHVDVKVVG